MHAVHQWLAILAGAFAGACLLVSVGGWITGRPARSLLDRLIVLQLAAIVPAVLVGGAIALLEGPPSDPLHFLYAVSVFVPLPLARYLGGSGSPRRRAGYLALGAIVSLGLIVRLFQTGAG